MRGKLFRGLMSILLAAAASAFATWSLADQERVSVPDVFLDGIPYDLTLSLAPQSDASTLTSVPALVVNDLTYQAEQTDDTWVFVGVTAHGTDTADLTLIINDAVSAAITVPVIPGWVSILPPLLAIGMALLLRSVLPALMFGL